MKSGVHQVRRAVWVAFAGLLAPLVHMSFAADVPAAKAPAAVASPARAQPASERLSMKMANGTQTVVLRRVRKIRVACLAQRCTADRVARGGTRGQPPPQLGEGGWAIPGSAVGCSLMQGSSVILHDNAMNQYDFCRFDDGSMVSLEDLYK